jgi:hypothetical protein
MNRLQCPAKMARPGGVSVEWPVGELLLSRYGDQGPDARQRG